MSKRTLGADSGQPQELSLDILTKLDTLEREQEAFVLADEFASMYKTISFYEQRREKLKSIPNFWPMVLQNDQMFATAYGDQREDLDAIKYLEDVWITRDKPDPRAYSIELHFKPNPYFNNSVIKKSWKLKKPPSGDQIHGVYDSMLLFNPDKDLDVECTRIEWKKDSVNLSKKYTRKSGDEGEELGSFFLFFETPEDDLDFGIHFANVLFANPIPYYKGEVDDSDEDEDMSSSEDEDSDADEIDLERPKKRVKLA